jgi:hypothetical protein
MDGIDVTAAKAKIERVKGRLAELDALDRELDVLLGAAPSAATATTASATTAPASPRPSKRRAGPKPPKSKGARRKTTTAPVEAKPTRRSSEPTTPKAAIVKLLEDGPLSAEEFGAGLAAIPESIGSHEAKRQALARLAKAGTVQKLANGGYQLARPT